MSGHSDSGSSGLTDWALVNSQGELESSDVESNTSSIEVVGQEAEEEESGHGAAVSRETSPECFELEQLMRKADAESTEQRVPELKEAPVAESVVVPDDSSDASASLPKQQPQEVAGACCPELLQSAERRQSTGEGEVKVTTDRQLSQESDSHTSSESILSLSEISSLSNTSKSSRADSDSESDFVRLEKESPSVSSHDSEEEEPMPVSGVIAMTTSGSSVGSGFNFLCGTRASSEPPSLSQPLMHPPAPLLPPQHLHQQEDEQQQPLQALPVEQLPPAPLPSAPVPQAEWAPVPQEPERPPSPQEEEEVEVQHEEFEVQPDVEVQPEAVEVQHQMLLHQQPEAVEAAAAMVMHDADDTESSIGDHDEDDRIESEQSDDTNSAHADDQGDLSLVNDLGDLPLERGGVERHYTHHNNQQLNGRLNQVLLAVVVLAVGMGLGHWIGSAREHFSQMEIQLAQMKRMHQMQDEYVQCLARNDELLLDYDNTLQGERDRHQEAMADLRDNNRELQEQLQDAQDQLERILTAQAQEARSRNSRSGSGRQGQSSNPTLADVQNALTMSRLLIADDADFEAHTATWSDESRQALLKARMSLAKNTEDQQRGSRNPEITEMLQERDQLTLLLGEARQQINNLKTENAELRVSVGKMRYNVDSLAREPAAQVPSLEEEEEEPESMPLPPPPNPIPPPPFVVDIPAEEFLDGVEVEVEEEDFIEDVPEQRPPHDILVAETRHPKLVYSSDSPKTVPVDVTLLQRNLTQERQRADMWRRLYLSARVENRKEEPVNSSACLRFLSQQMNMSALMHYVMHWNLTRVGSTEDFVNLTTLVSSIVQVQRNLVDALPTLWGELSSTFHSLHNKEDTDEEDRSSSAGNSADETPDAESDKDEPHKSKWSDGVKKLFNKTRGTLSNVSQQLQQTWSQVKDASRQFWSGDDTVLGRMASRVKEGVSKLSHKVKKKASRWFKKHSKEERKGNKKKGRRAFQEEQLSEKPLKKRDDRQAAKHHGKKQSLHKNVPNKKRKFDHHDERNKEEEELQKKKKRQQKDGQGSHKNMEAKQDKRVKRSDKHAQSELSSPNHKDGKKQNKPRKHADKSEGHRDSRGERVEKHHKEKSEPARHHQNGLGDGEKEAKFDQPKKDKVRHQKHLQDTPDGTRKQVKMSQPRKGEEIKSKVSADDSHGKRTMSAESSDHHPGATSQNIETEFLTKAKDHSSHAEKAAAKAKFKLEKRFQKLFSRIGSMGRHGFNHLDEEDISEMIHEIGDINRLYDEGNSLGLPESGHHWLRCQFYWWVKAQTQAQLQRMLYLPSDNCIQYLAQWQLNLMEETKAKLETGECWRKRKLSCIDPPPEDEEDYFKYVCFGDEGYHRSEVDENAQEAMDTVHSKNNMKEAHHSPKGTRENDPHNENSRKEDEVSEHTKQQVNQTEEDNAWYFKWVQGRDNLRAGEHKADWVFERAADRDESRHLEHTADWMFERAADRDEHRQRDDDEDDDGDDDDDEEEEENNHWRAQRRDWNKHRERGPHFKHKGSKRRHESKEGPFKHHGQDFRQKYGKTTSCDFC